METVFKWRRDTAERWAFVNPILSEGEPGLEKDTGKFKIGDGRKPWTKLPYFTPKETLSESNDTLLEHVHSQRPHPVYDDGPSLFLLYQNAKV